MTWSAILYTSRAPLLAVILAWVVLLAPTQVNDMLAAALDPQHFWTATIGWHLSLLLLALNAWHFARTALIARFDPDDTRTDLPGAARFLVAMPRTLYWAVVALGLCVTAKSAAYSLLVGVLVWGAGGYLFIRERRKIIQHLGIPPNKAPNATNGLPPPWWWLPIARLQLFLAVAPFTRWYVVVFSAIGMTAFLLAAMTALVRLDWAIALTVYIADWFRGPAVALIALAIAIGPLTALTFAIDGWHGQWRPSVYMPALPYCVPILSVLIAGILAGPELTPLHVIRLAAAPTMKIDDRPTLDGMFQNWVAQCVPGNGPVRPIIVAVSGGASRAGLWAARVLRAIETVSGDGGRIFAVNSVSGGSLGAGAWMAAQSDAACPNSFATHDAAFTGLGGDALAPALAGRLLLDIPRAFAGIPSRFIRAISGERAAPQGDSGAAFEIGFEHLWRASNDGKPARGLDQPFLGLYQAGGSAPRPGMPIWLAHSTMEQGGRRGLTVPFRSSEAASWPFRGSLDLLALLKGDIAISTAINMTDRFPGLSAAGEIMTMRPAPKDKTGKEEVVVTRLVDGGYFDNQGLVTALELADWLRGQTAPKGRKVEPIIVIANADADEGVLASDIVRCDGQSPDNPGNGPTEPQRGQIAAPILALLSTREGHNAVIQRSARDAYCKSHGFFNFYLHRPLPPEAFDIPLDWELSQKVINQIWNKSLCEPGNAAELTKLAAATGAPPGRCGG